MYTSTSIGTEINYCFLEADSRTGNSGDGNSKFVTYPDGSIGYAPIPEGAIHVAPSSTYVINSEGKKIYYSDDYKFIIKNPLNPQPDYFRNTGVTYFDFAYRAGYEVAYDGGSTYQYLVNLLIRSSDEGKEWGHYWIKGYKRGRYDRKNFYSNYLEFEY